MPAETESNLLRVKAQEQDAVTFRYRSHRNPAAQTYLRVVSRGHGNTRGEVRLMRRGHRKRQLKKSTCNSRTIVGVSNCLISHENAEMYIKPRFITKSKSNHNTTSSRQLSLNTQTQLTNVSLIQRVQPNHCQDHTSGPHRPPLR